MVGRRARPRLGAGPNTVPGRVSTMRISSLLVFLSLGSPSIFSAVITRRLQPLASQMEIVPSKPSVFNGL